MSEAKTSLLKKPKKVIVRDSWVQTAPDISHGYILRRPFTLEDPNGINLFNLGQYEWKPPAYKTIMIYKQPSVEDISQAQESKKSDKNQDSGDHIQERFINIMKKLDKNTEGYSDKDIFLAKWLGGGVIQNEESPKNVLPTVEKDELQNSDDWDDDDWETDNTLSETVDEIVNIEEQEINPSITYTVNLENYDDTTTVAEIDENLMMSIYKKNIVEELSDEDTEIHSDFEDEIFQEGAPSVIYVNQKINSDISFNSDIASQTESNFCYDDLSLPDVTPKDSKMINSSLDSEMSHEQNCFFQLLVELRSIKEDIQRQANQYENEHHKHKGDFVPSEQFEEDYTEVMKRIQKTFEDGTSEYLTLKDDDLVSSSRNILEPFLRMKEANKAQNCQDELKTLVERNEFSNKSVNRYKTNNGCLKQLLDMSKQSNNGDDMVFKMDKALKKAIAENDDSIKHLTGI